MKQTVAAYIAKTLEQAGVKRIWGVTGDSLNGLSDSLNKMKTIEWMPTRHEEVAAFAAGAEAQLTGELAVCAGSCGPGNLHLINGLFDCHRNHVPVLAIAAHIPSSEIGSGYFQETHPQELFRECSHYCELVSSPEPIPQVLALAMRKAVLNRGVSVVVIPGDVALKAAPEGASTHWYHAPQPVVTPAEEELKKLGFSFEDSKSNFIFATHKSVPAGKIFQALRERHIYVRYFEKPRIDNYLRITIGTREEMQTLFDFLKDYLKEG